MGIQQIETEEKEVTFLVNPDVKFVSLVKRGANQRPWKVVKSQDTSKANSGEAEKRKEVSKSGVRSIAHSLIIRDGVPEETVKEVLGDSIDSFKMDGPKTAGGWIRYEQPIVQSLKEDIETELVSLNEDGSIRALIAKVDDEEEQGFISKMFKPKKPSGVEINPEDVTKMGPEVSRAEYSNAIEGELYRLMEGVRGTLGQKMGSWSEKAGMVKTLCDNFMAYVNEGGQTFKMDGEVIELDPLPEAMVEEIKKAGAKMSKDRLSKMKAIMAQMQAVMNELSPEGWEDVNKGEEDEMKPEEIQEMINKSLKPLQDEVTVIKTSVEQVSKSATEMTAAVTTLTENVTKMGESVTKMQKTIPGGSVASKETDDVAGEKVFKSDKTNVKKGDEVFDGFFIAKEDLDTFRGGLSQ